MNKTLQQRGSILLWILRVMQYCRQHDKFSTSQLGRQGLALLVLDFPFS